MPQTTPVSDPAAAPADQVALHPRAAWRSVGDELFVITDDRAFHRVAAPTAVEIVRRLGQAPATLAELVGLLTKAYRVDLATAQRDTEAFVATLVSRHIAVRVSSAGQP